MTDEQKYISSAEFTEITTLGRLHIVNKSKKDYSCRECAAPILPGLKCYRQNVYNNSMFPSATRVCEGCAKILISRGCTTVDDAVKRKEKKEKQEKIQDTTQKEVRT